MSTEASGSSAPLAGAWTDAETKALLEFLLFHRGQSKLIISHRAVLAPVQHMRMQLNNWASGSDHLV